MKSLALYFSSRVTTVNRVSRAGRVMPYAITCREIDSLTGGADVQVERQGVKEFRSCSVPPHLCERDIKLMWVTGARNWVANISAWGHFVAKLYVLQ